MWTGPGHTETKALAGDKCQGDTSQDEVCGEGQALREAEQSGWAKGGQDAAL